MKRGLGDGSLIVEVLGMMFVIIYSIVLLTMSHGFSELGWSFIMLAVLNALAVILAFLRRSRLALSIVIGSAICAGLHFYFVLSLVSATLVQIALTVLLFVLFGEMDKRFKADEQQYIEERTARASRAKFDAALDKARDVEPEEYDR